MSIIKSFPATPNRMEILYHTLRQVDGEGIHVDKLKMALCPLPRRTTNEEEGGESGSTADDVLKEAITLGLLHQNDLGICRLDEGLDTDQEGLKEWFENVLLDTSRAAEAGQASFPFALAWLLEQDPYQPIDFGGNVQQLVNAQCDGQVFELTNTAAWQNFFYWCQYLGYAWRITASANRVVPDPTVALSNLLTKLLTSGQKIDLAELIALWANHTSVLEGGQARRTIISLRGDNSRDERTLSLTTSLALLSLRERGLIDMERRADSLAFSIMSPPYTEAVSHITLKGKL